MTSVKELGETLRKRQAVVEGAEATEDAMLGAVGSAYAILLVVGGCLVLALGALMASVGVVAPDLAWMVESLERMGIASGSVLAAGLSLLGLGLVAKELAQAQRAVLTAVRRTGGTTALAESQEEIREHLGKVHFALRVLQESTKSLLEASHEHSYKREDAEQEDAVFRLAASLDQLGLRLEDRLDSQQSGIERRLGALDSALEETRQCMAEWIESLPESAPDAGSGGDGHPGNDRRAHRSDADRHASQAEDANGELEVLVTLEDPPGRNDPGQDDSGRAPRGSSDRGTPLGVLDVLDEFGQGLGPDDDGPASSSFLFDPQLSARLEELEGFEADEEETASTTETQEKLAQLQSLLADSKLRRVLDELRDSGIEGDSAT